MKKLLLVLLLSTGLYASQENDNDDTSSFEDTDYNDLDDDTVNIGDVALFDENSNTTKFNLDDTDPQEISNPTDDRSLLQANSIGLNKHSYRNSMVSSENHTNPTSYECTPCKKSFLIKNLFIEHMQGHTYARPYQFTIDETQKNMPIYKVTFLKCGICDSSFSQHIDLKYHMNTHRGETQEEESEEEDIVDLLPERTNKDIIRQQQTTPLSGEKTPFKKTHKYTDDDHQDNFINKRKKPDINPTSTTNHKTVGLSSKTNITKSNIEGKYYQCTQCDYSTASSSDLTKHIRTHTGERPYQCTHEGCNYSTASSSNLTRHIRNHTGEKPYQCTHEGCDYSTGYKQSLNRHRRTIHKMEDIIYN